MLDSLHHQFAEQTLNHGSPLAGSPARYSEVVGQHGTKFRRQSHTIASARIAQSAAGSPAQRGDRPRQAKTSKRKINSRSPSPISPTPKRRPQRSEKARALPARYRLSAMRTSDCKSPRVAGSPAKQQNISRQASSEVTPRTSSPTAPSPESRPRRSDITRALPARQRLLAGLRQCQRQEPAFRKTSPIPESASATHTGIKGRLRRH